MTNEEAIAELKREIQWGKADIYPYVSKSMIEACEKAIKALEQEPCEDCISREAVLDTLHVEGRPTKRFDYVIAVKSDIIALPPVTPKEKTGKWEVYEVVDFGEWKGTEKYKCSECGEKVGVFKSNFCPNCGKRMVSE